MIPHFGSTQDQARKELTLANVAMFDCNEDWTSDPEEKKIKN